MSGKYSLAWFPNGPQAIAEILHWLGFNEVKLHDQFKTNEHDNNRGRIEIIAAREKGRLKGLKGRLL